MLLWKTVIDHTCTPPLGGPFKGRFFFSLPKNKTKKTETKKKIDINAVVEVLDLQKIPSGLGTDAGHLPSPAPN